MNHHNHDGAATMSENKRYPRRWIGINKPRGFPKCDYIEVKVSGGAAVACRADGTSECVGTEHDVESLAKAYGWEEELPSPAPDHAAPADWITPLAEQLVTSLRGNGPDAAYSRGFGFLSVRQEKGRRRMTTNPQAYAIAPLEFEKLTPMMWRAKTIFGEIYFLSIESRFHLLGPNSWFCCDLPTIEAAESVANHWHRERILPALIPVQQPNEGEA